MTKFVVRIVVWAVAALVIFGLVSLSWWWLIAAPFVIVAAVAAAAALPVLVDAPAAVRQTIKNRYAHFDANADEQNALYMSGDDKGVYGDFPPEKLA